MRKIYVDTCLIIAYYHENDPNSQHQRAINFLDRMKDMNAIELYCSPFTITEFTQAYVAINNIADEQAYEIANSLLLSNKIDRKYAFSLLETQGREENYKFEDFFLDIQTVLLNTTPRPGIADAIHAIIMNNNKIAEIVTFDMHDFENIENIKPSKPVDIR